MFDTPNHISNLPAGRRIRIAFVLWSFEGMGGSEHVVYDIVRKLAKESFEILIVGFKDGPARTIFEQSGAKVVAISKNKKIDFEFISSLKKIFLQHEIELINAHHFSPLLYSYIATRNTNIQIIYTEHSVWQYLDMNLAQKLISGYLLWRSNAIIAISNQLYQYYNNNFFVSKNKIQLIVNGIDLSRYKRFPDPLFREKLGFETRDVLIGMIANFRPEKNHRFLITAFSDLNKKVNNLHLILVGLDCMNGAVQKYASETDCEDRIHFLGARKDIVDILNTLDIFCLPSVHEGLPLTILEAMACGVPVVGANVLGINEVIMDGVNGLLYDADDKSMFVEKLMAIIQDNSLRASLQIAGQEYVRENFNLELKIKEYESLFIRMWGKKSK